MWLQALFYRHRKQTGPYQIWCGGLTHFSSFARTDFQ
jgi:hypothetical protein